MFGLIKRRQRAEHLKLLRQILEMAEELASFSDSVARAGIDAGGGAASDAAIFRSTTIDLTPVLDELEAKEGEILPPEVVQTLLTLWKDFRQRLDAIRAAEKAAHARLFGR